MIICKECKKSITNANYYCIDSRREYLCSEQCKNAFAKKEKDKEDKEFLYATISRIFGISSPNVQQLTELKRLREQDSLTNKQIASILHYVYDVKGFAPYGCSLTLVGKYKDEAKKWFEENKQRAERARQIAASTPVVMRRIEKVNTKRNKKRGLLQINPEEV